MDGVLLAQVRAGRSCCLLRINPATGTVCQPSTGGEDKGEAIYFVRKNTDPRVLSAQRTQQQTRGTISSDDTAANPGYAQLRQHSKSEEDILQPPDF